jgi:hypothetical protein
LKAEYFKLLSPEEREYVESVSHPLVARERLLARVLERTTLARHGWPVRRLAHVLIIFCPTELLLLPLVRALQAQWFTVSVARRLWNCFSAA